MSLDKTTELDSKSNMFSSKLIATQNIIKKKLEKARMIRVEQENDTNHAMKPLTTFSHAIASAIPNELKTKKSDSASKKSISRQRLARKIRLTDEKSRQNNINALCKRLRLLLSPQFANNAIHTHEISTILNDLHDLEIIL